MSDLKQTDAPTSDLGPPPAGPAATPTSYVREPDGIHPPLDSPEYRSSSFRHPKQPLLYLPQDITEITGPRFGADRVADSDHDLTRQHAGQPIGERIIVSGRVIDSDGRPLADTLVEVWQANSAGRYLHRRDNWDAPLDPNFSGAGRCLTDDRGRFRFVTIKPGPYPWGNHYNAWRPAHIHFSLLGRAFTQRLVTQMYFPGDPLFAYDPIFGSVRDAAARERMIATFSITDTVPSWAQAYHWEIVLRGPGATPFEEAL